VYRGIHLWFEGVNADLYRDRVAAAFELIDANASIYLRWLSSRLPALVVNQLFMVTRSVTWMDLRRGILIIHPYTVWKISAPELAVYLVGAATSARLGKRFARKRALVRRGKRVLEEAVEFARKLPGAELVVANWERRLADFRKRYSEAAA
jgi:uncharacterized protein involved in tolerance to divalent cations